MKLGKYSFGLLAFLLIQNCAPHASAPHAPAPQVERPEVVDGETIAIAGVSVIPMTTPGEIAFGRTVLVRAGRIIEIGSEEAVAVPPGALVIDGAGRFLIPGLMDMHVHLEHFPDPDLLTLFPAYGVTLVRNMDGRARLIEWRDAVARNEIPGPEIITAGPILDGDPPRLSDNTVVRSAKEAREAVRGQARAGYNFIKIYTNLSPEAYRAAVETAAEERLPVAGHIPREIGLRQALLSQQSIEHVTDYGLEIEAENSPHLNRWHWTKLFVGMPIDERKLRNLAALIAESDAWTVPTLVQPERALADTETLRAWIRAPELAPLPSEAVRYWEERLAGAAARMDEADWNLVELGKFNRRKIVEALHQAGAKLLVGTDTPNPFVVPGASVHEELQLLVEAGLSPAEALYAATSAPARFLGRSDIGTIEVGNQADLVLLQQNPLENIRATRDIIGVMLDGSWIPLDP